MEKFVLRSRALWGMLLPGLAVMAQQTGIGEDVFGQFQTVVEGLLGAAGAVMWLWHHFKPDPRTPKLNPAKALVTSLATVLAVGLVLPAGIGCQAIGKAEATPQQKFYEADTAALVALQAVAPAVIEVGPDKIPEKLKIALLGAAKSLKTLRTEARSWMTECGPESGCDLEKKLELGAASIAGVTRLVIQLTAEVRALEGS